MDGLPGELLTHREREALHHILAGASRQDAAEKLGISPGTLSVHLKHAYRKLGAHSAEEARGLFLLQEANRGVNPRAFGKQYILALDQSSSRSRALLFDSSGKIATIASKPVQEFHPHPGWTEQDPMELWASQAGVAAEALAQAGAGPFDVAAVGLTNQRETVVLWNRETGKPIYPAISWADLRTKEYCDRLNASGKGDWIRAKTGFPPTIFASAPKVAWALDNVPGARALANSGKLCFGTVDSWIIWNCTGRAYHVTDPSNASRTLLYNLFERRWDPELLRFFRIPASMLPRVCSSAGFFGKTAPPFSPSGVPIEGVIGDQQASLLGLRCLAPGTFKCSIGTGCFSMMNTGSEPVLPRPELSATVAWEIDGKPTYALEGCVFSCDAAFAWLRDNLFKLHDLDELDALCESVPDNGGVTFLPIFEGLGSPAWRPDASGFLVGVTPSTKRGHLVRAALEGIAHQVSETLRAMVEDFGKKTETIRVDGRNARSNLLQSLADITQLSVSRHYGHEARALGAAWLAARTIGFWPRKFPSSLLPAEKIFQPQWDSAKATTERGVWSRTAERFLR